MSIINGAESFGTRKKKNVRIDVKRGRRNRERHDQSELFTGGVFGEIGPQFLGQRCRTPIGRVRNGNACVNRAKERNAARGIGSIGDDGKSARTTGMPQERTDGCDLFRQRAFTGVGIDFEWKMPVRLDRAAHNRGKRRAVELADRVALSTGQMVSEVWHALTPWRAADCGIRGSSGRS